MKKLTSKEAKELAYKSRLQQELEEKLQYIYDNILYYCQQGKYEMKIEDRYLCNSDVRKELLDSGYTLQSNEDINHTNDSVWTIFWGYPDNGQESTEEKIDMAFT